jgi:hypothetical protein
MALRRTEHTVSPMYCSITIKGHLDQRWSEWFGGLAITQVENGTTLLAGRLPDQAALHGTLAKVRDLGLALVALQCDDATGAGDSPDGGASDLTHL